MSPATKTPLIRASQLLEHSTSASNTEFTQHVGGSRRQLENLVGRLTEVTGSARLSAIAPYIRQAQQSGHAVAWITTSNSLFYPPDFEDNGIHVENIPIVRAYNGEQAEAESDVAGGPGGAGGDRSASRDNIPAHPVQVQNGSTVRAMRAADTLLRASAFILIVLDINNSRPKQGALGRLLRLANVNDIALVALTTGTPYLGSLVSLRVRAEYAFIGKKSDKGSTFSGSANGRASGLPFSHSLGSNAESRERLHITLTALKDKQGGPYWSTEEDFLAPNGMR